MDLALATGRGEPLLTQWPAIVGPLVRDEDAMQLGERDALREDFRSSCSDIERTAITRYTIQSVLEAGIENIAQSSIAQLHTSGLDRVWLHVDLDVLAQSVMPAVDSPGSPGLTFAQLRALIARLYRSGLLAGATITIYDPARDLENRYAVPIVTTLGEAFTWS
jgi:arginase